MNILSFLFVLCFLLSALSCTAFGEAVEPEAYSSPVKVIVDTDMGIMNDDTLALSLLISAEEQGKIRILGLTLGGGNMFIDADYFNWGETQYGSAKNTKDILDQLQRTDIPFYRGTDFPIGFHRGNISELDDFYKNLHYLKWNDGYGAIHFFKAVDENRFCDRPDAVEFLKSSVAQNPGEVVILAIGPTMNIARAVREDPSFASNVKAIYYMGGAIGKTYLSEDMDSNPVEAIEGANVTPYTEYNVLYDPLAFQQCITAGFPQQYVFPGSVNVGIGPEIPDAIQEKCKPGSRIGRLWADFFRENLQPYPFWDPITALAFLDPEIITKAETSYVTVDCDRTAETFGETRAVPEADYLKLSPAEQERYGKATVVYDVKNFWPKAIDLLCAE